MTIERIRPEPRMSDIVIHNNTIYYTAVPENLDADAKIRQRKRWRLLTPRWRKQAQTRVKFLMPPCFWSIKMISRQ